MINSLGIIRESSCAHCGAPVSLTHEQAANDVRTQANIRSTHCWVCTNLVVCAAVCETCGRSPSGGPCEMER